MTQRALIILDVEIDTDHPDPLLDVMRPIFELVNTGRLPASTVAHAAIGTSRDAVRGALGITDS